MFPITLGGKITAVATLVVGLGIFGTFLSLIGSAFMETLQSKNSISLSKTTQHALVEIQNKRGMPADEDSLKDLAGNIITEYKQRQETITRNAV